MTIPVHRSRKLSLYLAVLQWTCIALAVLNIVAPLSPEVLACGGGRHAERVLQIARRGNRLVSAGPFLSAHFLLLALALFFTRKRVNRLDHGHPRVHLVALHGALVVAFGITLSMQFSVCRSDSSTAVLGYFFIPIYASGTALIVYLGLWVGGGVAKLVVRGSK